MGRGCTRGTDSGRLTSPSPGGAGGPEGVSGMIDWVLLRTGARPVPSPLATPLVWAAATGGALVLVALLNALIGPGRPSPALAALSCSRYCSACAPASRRSPGPRCCAGSSSTASPSRPGRHSHLGRTPRRVLARLPVHRRPGGHGPGPTSPRPSRLPPSHHGHRRPDTDRIMNGVAARRAVPPCGRPGRPLRAGHSVG